MRTVIEYERAQGRQVTEVHDKNRGYDLTSLDRRSGELRLIEVKGLAGLKGDGPTHAQGMPRRGGPRRLLLALRRHELRDLAPTSGADQGPRPLRVTRDRQGGALLPVGGCVNPADAGARRLGAVWRKGRCAESGFGRVPQGRKLPHGNARLRRHVLALREVPRFRLRMVDQMVQAARSGRQHIAEGSCTSATSSQTEVRLLNTARAPVRERIGRIRRIRPIGRIMGSLLSQDREGRAAGNGDARQGHVPRLRGGTAARARAGAACGAARRGGRGVRFQ